jgi:uncharacterized protein DUF4440
MKYLSVSIFSIIFFSGCISSKNKTSAYTYKPDDQKLYDTILHLDSLFFHYYNTCDVNLDKYAAFYSDSIEFYHDYGGLNTSKTEIVDATKRNICGKVTRELVKGSIEVYPIKNYGAIEMGLHQFHNNQEKEPAVPRISRFIVIWKYKSGEWKIARVVSLH